MNNKLLNVAMVDNDGMMGSLEDKTENTYIYIYLASHYESDDSYNSETYVFLFIVLGLRMASTKAPWGLPTFV